MTSRVQEIRDASATLDSLNKRINETVRTRDRGAEERERWSRACAEFHTKYAELFYPGGDASLDALKRHESGAIQLALDFLDADPHHFRSGCTKEEVWRRVRNAPLIAKDKLRLEEIAIRYLDRRISREFWAMARVMPVVASSKFWDRVRGLAESEGDPKKTRAAYLLVYEQGAAAGGQNRVKVYREWLARKYRERHSRIGPAHCVN
jgi:hypothetical protein